MTSEQTFQDEWFLKALEPLQLPGDIIDGARRSGATHLSQALLKQNVVSWEQLSQAFTQAFNIPAIDLSAKDVEKMALSLLTQNICEKLHLIPLHINNNVITVAMANPFDAEAQNQVQLLAAREVSAVYALPEKIESLVAECYSDDMMVVDLIEKLDVNDKAEFLDVSGTPNAALEAVGTMERFVNDMITKAVLMEATEVRVDHGRNASEVRYLIDGMIRTILTMPKTMATGPVATRIKTMGGLDVAEHTRPQQGRAKLRIAGKELGLRIFSRGTPQGERLAVRILDERIAALPFDKLGFRPALASKLESLLKAPQGMMVVTGPSSSGKTSTLYALLNAVKATQARLSTVEDPVEFKLTGIPQMQVNEKQGLNYATALRAALRGDPQVVLLGEIRDAETAGVALQAAASGRRVLTALHTDDTYSALTRFLDMGLSADKVAPALLACLSQRLVRRLCPTCRKPVESENLDPVVVAAFKAEGLAPGYSRASGCEECNFTGYRGRLALLELIVVKEELKQQILSNTGEKEFRQTALLNKCLDTLHGDALWHLSAGDTTLTEVTPYLALDSFKEAAAAEKAQKEAAKAAGESAKKRILVTDDDAVIRTVLRKSLEGQGFVVEEAGDGFQALAKVAEKAPDLMLLDLDMPGMDGYGVLKMLRRRMGMVKLPVIMLTANDDDKSQEEAMSLGADDYVLKPFKPNIILARINAVFRRSES